MPTSRKRIVDCVFVGEPPKKLLKDVETVQFVIYNFKDREEKWDDSHRASRKSPFNLTFFTSPTAKAHGYKWRIRCYPRDLNASLKDEECVSYCLEYHGQKNVTATFAFRSKWRQIAEMSIPRIFERLSCWSNPNPGYPSRKDVIANCLEEDGSFVIECDIQIAAENKRVWYPKQLQRQDIWVELYQDASSETSDVIFSVEKKLFRVHKIILSLRGKKLYEIVKDCDNDEVPIPIPSVKAEIFKSILDFVYTVKTPDIENKDIATELLVVADRYDCVHLKLYVESVMVEKFLTFENAAAFLVFADSHSCALLKEAATNLFVTDPEAVKNAEAWSTIEESKRLLNELLLVCSKKLVEARDRTGEIDGLDVATLREELGEANLELDGSREVLINRLNTHRQNQGEVPKGNDTTAEQ